MKCANCGSEVMGNFCSECGMPRGYLSPEPSMVKLYGQFVDLRRLVERHGTNYVGAVKEIREMTGCDLREGKSIMETAYNEFGKHLKRPIWWRS